MEDAILVHKLPDQEYWDFFVVQDMNDIFDGRSNEAALAVPVPMTPSAAAMAIRFNVIGSVQGFINFFAQAFLYGTMKMPS
jgi:hypothetical protein